MSIKNLFGKSIPSYEDVAKDVESTDFIDEVVAKRETYLPPIDFSDPANFVFYGSAELYYEAAIKRIYEDYPYDGSKAEQIEFEEKSSYLERWLFENKYPKTTGHVELGTTGTGSVGNIWEDPTSTHEYIRVWGGLHVDESAETLTEHLEGSAKYQEDKNRNQNWACDFDIGVTTEFWLKKDDTWNNANTTEVIFDLHNGESLETAGSRLVLALKRTSQTEAKFYLGIDRGTGIFISVINSAQAVDLNNWKHFAFTFYKESNRLYVRMYVNGELHTEADYSYSGTPDNIPGKVDGYIGALQSEVGSIGFEQGGEGYGKLLAYLDEFRFWKTRRTDRQIKLNWFREIGGGANTDDATSNLGVYLKFNEGITGNTSIDSTVLDYSGRLANGTWIGYPGSSARSTGSAMTAAGYVEKPSPIIYSNHPDVVSLESEMTLSGSDYDSGRGQAFYRSLPNWLVEEDMHEGQENLRKISHILASYMDTLKVQIDSLNTLQDKKYVGAEYKAAPFASELLKNKGFTTSEMFLSSEVFEAFSEIDYDSGQYDLNIDEIKNLIFTNIYNNLENIYNSKGTEKSIRNLIRCFGIDDELIKLNQYTDLGTQYLGDKYRTTSVKKKYINLNNPDHFDGTIYQSGSLTFISGASEASVSAFTMEADILVPKKKNVGEEGYFATPFLSASVMGFHEAMPTNASNFTWWATNTGTAAATGAINTPSGPISVTDFDGETITITDTSGLTKTYEFASGTSNGTVLPNGNIAINTSSANGTTMARIAIAINHTNGHNGSITAASPGATLTNLTQATTGANGNTIITTTLDSSLLTVTSFTGGTSTFGEARDLQVYLVRDKLGSNHAQFVLKNQSETIYATSSYIQDIYENEHYNVALRIKPETYPYAGNVTNTTPNYTIELYAVSHNFDEIKEEVLVTTTVDNITGSAYMQAPKRIYAASHYQDFTGSLLQRTDLQFGRVSAWLDYLDDASIREHNKDVLNHGNSKSIDGSNAFSIDDVQIPSMELSILNWDFDTVTVSDGAGEFVIEDTTSGSSDTIYGWVDNIIRREHDGKGDNFPTESSAFLENEFLYAYKKQLPETSFNVNNIFIKGDEEINFGEDDDVSDNLFILEKSPASIVSEEMLKLFSTTQEFSNLFGRHIDRYRIEYKDLAKARQLFYQRADSGIDFDKFFGYFKWIDQSVSEMINQLVPASVNFAGGVVDVIEPHILERDKYQRQIGLLQTVTSTEASIRGVQELNYNYRIGRAPLPSEGLTTNSLWQKERLDRDNSVREVLVRQNDQEFVNPVRLSGSNGEVSGSYAVRRFSRPVRAGIEFSNSIHGGTNYSKSKNRDFLRSGIGLHSNVGSSGAPKNVITFGAGPGIGLGYDEALVFKDTKKPNEKIKIDGFGIVGKYTDFQTSGYPPLDPSFDYSSRLKVSDIFIGNIISSSLDTGYQSKINTSGSGYREGVNIVNLHSDTVDITNEIPIQGPFTERWVGGHQHRHVELNSVGKPERLAQSGFNGLDHSFSRPEGWRLLIGKNPLAVTDPDTETDTPPSDVDGAIGFTAPDYGISRHNTFPDTDRLYAIYYREERAKRPVNIKNIQTLTSSAYHGNYQHEYEVFSTVGDQGYFLKRAGDLLPQTISQDLPETTNYMTLVGQSPYPFGNTFSSSSNRYSDTDRVIFSPEITGQTASGGEFSVSGSDFVSDGNSLAIVEDSGANIYYINNGPMVGTIVPTGSSDTDFFINLQTAIQSNMADFNVTRVDDLKTSLGISFSDRTNNTGLSTSTAVSFDGVEPFTISFHTLFDSTLGSLRFIYSEVSTSGSGRQIYIDGAGTLRFKINYVDATPTNRTDEYYINGFLQNYGGATQHIVITKGSSFGAAGGSDADLYVNNSLVAWSGTSLPAITLPATIRSINSFNLACEKPNVYSTTGFSVVGQTSYLDEVIILNKKSNSDDVNELYNSGQKWDLSNPPVISIDYNNDVESIYTFEESGDGFSNSDAIYDAKGPNRLTVSDPSTKVNQADLGILTGVPFSEFTITPINTGSYGNFSLSSATTDFFDLSNSTGGVDYAAEVSVLGIDNTIETQDRSTGSAHVIRTRFSAPGGPEVNSSGYLDVATQQYSVHNSMNFRNLAVRSSGSGEDGTIRLVSHSNRREGLRTLRTRHQGQFGIDSQHGVVSSTDYSAEASYHKQHRNTRKVAALLLDSGGDEYLDVVSKYDNDHYHSTLPASEFQYSWINSAISGSNWEDNQIILTYAPRNGLISSSAGITEAIIFPSASSFYGE